jgi:myo-inositol 2-dehydrogenase / D-chiro-inositol 1-dehydrogenase
MNNIAFGLIGFGAWGSHHARVIAAGQGTKLAAIADDDAGRRTEALATHPQAVVLADYGEMLARADLSAVSVALPSHLHHAVSRAVLESGKHLFL